jgi:hypothetical protein
MTLPGAKRQILLTPDALGLNDIALNVTTTGAAFQAQAFNALTVAVKHTNDSATVVSVGLQSYLEALTGWGTNKTARFENGRGTLKTMWVDQEVSGDDSWIFTLNLRNYFQARLLLASTGGTASDKAIVAAYLGSI